MTACAGGAPLKPSSLARAPEAMWQRLHRPRPAALSGAVRLSVSELTVLADLWPGDVLPADVGLHELVAAGLIRRRDVRFVERRRFARAAEREASGLPAPKNAPPTGVSAGAQLLLTGSWIPTGDSATLDLRLVDAETSAVLAAWRTTTVGGSDPAGVARTVVGSTIAALRGIGRLPAWNDPLATSTLEPAPDVFRPSGVPAEAAAAFFRGVAAEDRFEWEAARRGYQAAAELAGTSFFEPDVALARVARLRAGGSLGVSDR